MSSNNRISGFVKKHGLIIWIFVASALLLSAIIVYASYANSNTKIKRVIAPAAKSEGLFTSNYLSLGTSNIRLAYMENEPYTYTVDIRNYNPSDPETVFDGNLTYTFKAYLAHKDGRLYDTTNDATALAAMSSGNMSITIVYGSESITLNGNTLSGQNTNTLTLTGSGLSGTNTWTVSYNNIGLDTDYCVKFEAIPASGTNLEDLSATVIVASYPEVNPEGWSCAIAESGTIGNYDAFNYTITGVGQRDLKFSYDASKLTVNVANYQLVSEVVAPDSYSGSGTDATKYATWRTIEINANPDTTGVNRYDFQVYKINPYSPSSFDELSPNGVGSYVEFEESSE